MPTHERDIQQIHYSLKQEINELYLAIAIKNFAIGLIAIFTVIYVYLYFDQSIPKTFTFYLVQFLGQVLLLPLAAKLIHRVGIKKMMAIGTPFLAFYLISLALAQSYGFIFIVLAIITKIIYLTIFWPSRHIDFARFTQTAKRGRQIGLANIIITLVKIIAPLLGGLIIIQYGFIPLFVLAGILLIFSSIPLFFSPEVYETYTLSWRESFRYLIQKKNRRISLAFFLDGFEFSTAIFLFAIFIYLVIGKYETIGLVTSASLLATLIFTYIIGWLTDRHGSKKLISYASVIHGFSWLMNSFISSPFQYLIISSFYKLAETGNRLPFSTLFYKQAKDRGQGIDEYIVLHEISHNLGRVLMCAVVIIGFSLGFNNFLLYFALASLAAFGIRIIKKV